MGLRIGTNVGALSALRNLRNVNVSRNRTFEQLSSGLRINRGSDDPAGLELLLRLRSDLEGLQQAGENTQNAANLVRTADAALGTVSDRLVDLRGNLTAALNTGVLGNEARFALQSSIDQTLSSINRTAATTRFADRELLNGSFAFEISGRSGELVDVRVQGGRFTGGFPFEVNVSVSAAATRAEAAGTIAATQSGESVVRITGNRGTQELSFRAGTTRAEVVEAINAVSDVTGVEATDAGEIRSTEVGSAQRINLQELSGDLEGITAGASTGTDIIASVDGGEATGRGNTVISGGPIEAEVTVAEGETGSFSFTVVGGGARFQLGPYAGGSNDFSLGIDRIGTSVLGQSSGVGVLDDLATGGAASIGEDPGRGLAIVEAAQREVAGTRGRLGAVERQIFEPNIRALDVAFENLSASASGIGDADIAETVARSIRDRLLQDAGIFVLRQANLDARQALKLIS